MILCATEIGKNVVIDSEGSDHLLSIMYGWNLTLQPLQDFLHGIAQSPTKLILRRDRLRNDNTESSPSGREWQHKKEEGYHF